MRNGKEENESIAHLVVEGGLIERIYRLKKLVVQSAVRRHSKHRDSGSLLSKAPLPTYVGNVYWHPQYPGCTPDSVVTYLGTWLTISVRAQFDQRNIFCFR